LTVSRAHLEKYIQTTKIHVSGRCPELVFDLDELVSADWEDCIVRKVIMRAGFIIIVILYCYTVGICLCGR
jgi:hypothetical protein